MTLIKLSCVGYVGGDRVSHLGEGQAQAGGGPQDVGQVWNWQVHGLEQQGQWDSRYDIIFYQNYQVFLLIC